jgi:hypothetical protein
MKVYINNYNLVTWPQHMAQILSAQGHYVVFVDNGSTFQPLVEFYEHCPFDVVRLERNLGHAAPWIANVVDTSDYYVVTDPDLDLGGLPQDWPEKLCEGVNRFGAKCGLSLDETRVPSSNPAYYLDEFYLYPEGNHPARWGSQVMLPGGYFNLPTDTTFAVYGPGIGYFIGGVRAARPYTARHLPWHLVREIDDDSPALQIPVCDEHLYYFRTAGPSSTTRKRMISTGWIGG